MTQCLSPDRGGLQRDFRTAANQLRQTGRRLRTTSRHYLDAADILDQWAATVNDIVRTAYHYHELMAETADRERHAELLRQIAFKGTAKTAANTSVPTSATAPAEVEEGVPSDPFSE